MVASRHVSAADPGGVSNGWGMAGLSVLLVFLPLACAHPAPPDVRTSGAHPREGGIWVPIRTAEDVVGHYVEMPGRQPLDIYTDAGDLCMRARNGETYRLAIRKDGRLAVPGHFGAGLTRQGTRTFLSISWAYAYGLYERTGSIQPGTILGSCHDHRAPELVE